MSSATLASTLGMASNTGIRNIEKLLSPEKRSASEIHEIQLQREKNAQATRTPLLS